MLVQSNLSHSSTFDREQQNADSIREFLTDWAVLKLGEMSQYHPIKAPLSFKDVVPQDAIITHDGYLTYRFNVKLTNRAREYMSLEDIEHGLNYNIFRSNNHKSHAEFAINLYNRGIRVFYPLFAVDSIRDNHDRNMIVFDLALLTENYVHSFDGKDDSEIPYWVSTFGGLKA